VVRDTTGREVDGIPGAGAAGGIAASLVGLFGARIVGGLEIIAELVGLEEKIKDSDLVLTGEGKLDGQTVNGKVPWGVAQIAGKYGITVFAVAGMILPEAEILNDHGISGFFCTVSRPMSLEEAMENASELMEAAGRRIGYLLEAVELRRGSGGAEK